MLRAGGDGPSPFRHELESGDDLTQLIQRSQAGEPGAQSTLFDRIYGDLLRIARQQRFVGRDGETMQPTVLANEAFIRFSRRLPGAGSGIQNRREFFRIAGLAMRGILRDYWRGKTAEKRGGRGPRAGMGRETVSEPADHAAPLDRLEFLAIDEALSALEIYNRRWYEVVLHRYFAGRSIEETAQLLDLGTTTVKADWKYARVWMKRYLDGSDA